jgi:aryl-phospho-beta-D-glucosidase BglC (GH1 family)
MWSKTLKRIGKFVFGAVLGASLVLTNMVSSLGLTGHENTEAQAAEISTSDFLKADGKLIRKNWGTGETVYLRGTNAGGYLVQEFWMCPTQYSSGVNCEMDIYRTLTNRFGEAKMRELVNLYQDNYWTEKDFDNCAEMGVNCIRLPIWYMNLVDFNGNLLNNAFDRIDWFVREAGERGIYVILDMHGAPGSQNGSDHSGIDGGDQKQAASQFFWGSSAAANQNLYYALWEKIASRYKGNPTVAGYDLLNEPYCTYRYNSGYSDNELRTQLWNIYDKAYNVIRSVDPDHMIIMESTWDAVDLPNPDRYGWKNVMYEYHNYMYDDYDNANGKQISNMQNKLDGITRANYNVPSYMGEFCYMNNYDAWSAGVKLLNDAGLNWTTWTYKVTGSNNNWGLYNQPGLESVNISTDSESTIRSKWGKVGYSVQNTRLVNAIKAYLPGTNQSTASLKAENGDYYLTSAANGQVVCAENSGAAPLAAVRESFGGAWETLSLVNNSDGTVSLKSGANGKYICAVIDEENQLLARSENIGTWEKFHLVRINNEQCALKAVANGKYVKADLDNKAVLKASSDSVAGAWEAFTLTKADQSSSGNGQEEVKETLKEGKYYLTATANGQVVCAEEGGAAAIAATRASYGGAWETFYVVGNGDGTISLKSEANGKYVCAVIDSISELLPRSGQIDTWEKFIPVRVNENQYALQSMANGKYVKADLNNGGRLVAVSESVAGAWETFTFTVID